MDVPLDALWHIGGPIGSGLVAAGTFYWRVVSNERAVERLRGEIDQMPHREAVLRAQFTQEVGEARALINKHTDELWSGMQRVEDAQNTDRHETNKFREATSIAMGKMLTREVLDQALRDQEQRLGTMLSSIVHAGAKK